MLRTSTALSFSSLLWSLIFLASMASATPLPKVGIMETAFGNRAQVESVELAKQAGYAGVQIHTGFLDDKGVLDIAQPGRIEAFKEASETHGVEIVSLCAGLMNRYAAWKPDSREKAISVGTQSILACKALDVPILLVPFFSRAEFGNDPESPKFEAVLSMLAELLPIAEANEVILAVEGPSKQPIIDVMLQTLDHPNLKVYYDTGNMLDQGEDVYSVIRHWGPEKIAQIHLKPFQSPQGVFGEGTTDLAGLAAALRETGYDRWFVFEAGNGTYEKNLEFATANRLAMQAFLTTLQPVQCELP